jgi:5'-3' exonuclease
MANPSTEGTEVVLIDLSSLAHPIWHVTQSDPNPNKASEQIVARVLALASGHPKVIVCCDSGRSFRHDLSPEYKANRPPQEAPLHHQIGLAVDQLKREGFPVWSAKGFEADDVIATAAWKLTANTESDQTVLIVSADKDLLQMVGPRVRAMSARDGSIVDAEAVGAKFGVTPAQMRDYLTLVGDSSDNVKGAPGIGPKKAADLLAKFGSIDNLYQELDQLGGAALGLPPAISKVLRDFRPQMDATRSLITLRLDVELPWEELDAPRVSQAVQSFDLEPDDEDGDEEFLPEANARSSPAAITSSGPAAGSVGSAGMTLAVRPPDVDMTQSATGEWERQLDPRTMKDARVLAKDMHDSRMFSAYGSPQAVLSTVMVGRELGLPAMASLRSIHVVEGRHTLSAALMVALVLKSGLAEYFEPISFTDTEATFETKRKGARNPVRLTHTIDMAKTAQLLKPSSNWEKVPTDMLVARAQSRLARMVYPDLLAGLYTPDELKESAREAA